MFGWAYWCYQPLIWKACKISIIHECFYTISKISLFLSHVSHLLWSAILGDKVYNVNNLLKTKADLASLHVFTSFFNFFILFLYLNYFISLFIYYVFYFQALYRVFNKHIFFLFQHTFHCFCIHFYIQSVKQDHLNIYVLLVLELLVL